jgi:hypothetical protein
MIIGSKNSCNFKVSINNNSIIKTSEIKILEVIFDDLLKFDSHINARALKASKFLRIFSKFDTAITANHEVMPDTTF